MKLGVMLMKTLFPQREAERMEVRRCVTRAEAEAEDLVRSIEQNFKDGKLLDPEIVRVWDENSVVFRGEIVKI